MSRHTPVTISPAEIASQLEQLGQSDGWRLHILPILAGLQKAGAESYGTLAEPTTTAKFEHLRAKASLASELRWQVEQRPADIRQALEELGVD